MYQVELIGAMIATFFPFLFCSFFGVHTVLRWEGSGNVQKSPAEVLPVRDSNSSAVAAEKKVVECMMVVMWKCRMWKG